MTSKHWALVGGAVACLSSYSAFASPWVEPGDVRARYALQKLADRGHFNRSTTTWPVSWADINSGVDRSSLAQDRSAAEAHAYLQFEMEENAQSGFRAELALSATSDPAFLRGFSEKAEQAGEVNLDLQWQGDYWAVGVSPAVSANPEDDDTLKFDGSYLAATANNWVLGAGAIDRWWGPGWQHSLILSNNARPLPSVWLNRNETTAPQSEWLDWIGPWQLTVLSGELDSNRVAPDEKLIGMRFAFRPIRGLDIGLSRVLLFGGEGRSENLSTVWNILIGRDNSQGGLENNPGSQLGSVDVRYGFAVGGQSMSFYSQLMRDDEAAAFSARESWLLGSDWTSSLLTHEQQWFLEYANSLADDVLGDPMSKIPSDHLQHRTGYYYYGRSIGGSVAGDAEAITLGVFNFFSDGSNLGLKLTGARLNDNGVPGARATGSSVFAYLPTKAQDITVLESSYETEVLSGWLNLRASFTDKNIQLLGGEKDQWALSASWRYRF